MWKYRNYGIAANQGIISVSSAKNLHSTIVSRKWTNLKRRLTTHWTSYYTNFSTLLKGSVSFYFKFKKQIQPYCKLGIQFWMIITIKPCTPARKLSIHLKYSTSCAIRILSMVNLLVAYLLWPCTEAINSEHPWKLFICGDWGNRTHTLIVPECDWQRICCKFSYLCTFLVTTPSLELGNLSSLRGGLPQTFRFRLWC